MFDVRIAPARVIDDLVIARERRIPRPLPVSIFVFSGC